MMRRMSISASRVPLADDQRSGSDRLRPAVFRQGCRVFADGYGRTVAIRLNAAPGHAASHEERRHHR